MASNVCSSDSLNDSSDNERSPFLPENQPKMNSSDTSFVNKLANRQVSTIFNQIYTEISSNFAWVMATLNLF